jgi:hypothetical protein
MRRFIQDRWGASRQLRQAAPWIGITLGLAICAGIIYFGAPSGAASIARLVFVGFTAALFTRFFGSIGMYKDAISDLFREDTWLDRRNDLEDLWRHVTRRVFMPGSDASGYIDMLEKVNGAMSQLLGDEKTRKPYFLRGAGMTFTLPGTTKSRDL